MSKFFLSCVGAILLASVHGAKIVSLDPTGTVEAQAEIVELFKSCKIDVLVDVRSKYYNSNFRLEGGRHYANGLEQDFTAEWNTRVETEKIKSIGIYCWTSPFQSTHGASWLQSFLSDPKYDNLTIYDVKGLQYLMKIPGMCPYIQTPGCNSTDTACRASWVKECENVQARSREGEFCKEEAERKAKEAEEIARQIAEQKALEEAARKAAEQARIEAELARKEREDCSDAMCTEDLCEDGKGRRKIGDDCCACPSVKNGDNVYSDDNTNNAVEAKPWYEPGEPGFMALVIGGAVVLVLVIASIFVVRKVRRSREERVEEVTKAKNQKRVVPDIKYASSDVKGPVSYTL